jgi:hypothetical protein
MFSGAKSIGQSTEPWAVLNISWEDDGGGFVEVIFFDILEGGAEQEIFKSTFLVEYEVQTHIQNNIKGRGLNRIDSEEKFDEVNEYLSLDGGEWREDLGIGLWSVTSEYEPYEVGDHSIR